MQLLNRLKLWQKLGFLVMTMALPTALFGFLYLRAANHEVSQAHNELESTRYSYHLGFVLHEVSRDRSLLFALRSGDSAQSAPVAASEARMKVLMSDVDAINATVGGKLHVTKQWQAVKNDWAALTTDQSKMTAEQAAARDAAVMGRIIALSRMIVARSALNVDPSPQTAALIRIATRDVPNALIASGNVQWYATRAAINGRLSGGDSRAIQIYHRQVLEDLTQAGRDLNGTSHAVRAKLRPMLRSALLALNTSFDLIRTRILQARRVTISTAQLFANSQSLDAGLQPLLISGYSAMDAAVKHRVSRVTTSRALAVGITVMVLLVVIALSWLMATAFAMRIARAITVFERISAGEYDNRIEVDGKDEASQVLRSLEEMQGKLRGRIENERLIATENARIRQALDSVSVGVMVADTGGNIIYLNPTVSNLLAGMEQDIRRELPGFNAATIRGSNMDLFHRNPAHPRSLVAKVSSTHHSQFAFCGHMIALTFNPVVSEGERIGTVVEWKDRTQEVAVEKEMQEMLAAVAAGQLDKRIDTGGKSGFFQIMSSGVNRLADNMTEVVSRVQQVATEVRRGADEISSGNANLSQRTEEQSSSLEETASSMEEMTTTVKQNADNAAQANQLALAAREQAEKGGAVVGQAVAAMSDINQASNKIADIISVVDEIAFQTNLLALNAAVEAARAGEQGRGFAVVASEVRSLAGRSATAAKEIKGLIQDSVRKVEDGSVLVTQSGDTLEKIVAAVKKVSDIVAEIAAASREQSTGIEQVNRAVMQMDEMTQQNAALVEQATAASQSMVEQVRGLNEALARFDIGGSAGHTPQPHAVPTDRPGNTARASGEPANEPPRAGVERRKADRPWAGRKATGRATPPPARGPAKLAAVAPGAAQAAPAEDSEWEEF